MLISLVSKFYTLTACGTWDAAPFTSPGVLKGRHTALDPALIRSPRALLTAEGHLAWDSADCSHISTYNPPHWLLCHSLRKNGNKKDDFLPPIPPLNSLNVGYFPLKVTDSKTWPEATWDQHCIHIRGPHGRKDRMHGSRVITQDLLLRGTRFFMQWPPTHTHTHTSHAHLAPREI